MIDKIVTAMVADIALSDNPHEIEQLNLDRENDAIIHLEGRLDLMRLARAAVVAMREPSEAMVWQEVKKMIMASDSVTPGAATYEGCAVAIRSAWQGMIDTALKEP